MQKTQNLINKIVKHALNVLPSTSTVNEPRRSDIDLSIWHRVNCELTDVGVHQQFWWSQHSGKALAVLLYHAGYSPDLQYRDLKFFAQVVAPQLGTSPDITGADDRQWQSFMTDDGTPIEMSWDWGTKDYPPIVRYSIEPIGLHAGTPMDPGNHLAGPLFQEHLVQALSNMRLEWYCYLDNFFNDNNGPGSDFRKDANDHNSSIFYALDLSADGVTPKVYFFPKFKARTTNQSNLEVLIQAVRGIPFSTQENLKACDVFHEFSSDPTNEGLEYEMLAIDLIDPHESRLKIYFRSRQTTFNSIANIMTLGGQIKNPNVCKGLKDLARLWKNLFGIGLDAPDQPLVAIDHRTAGILYNCEFRLGDPFPITKVYLPVRHYSNSDEMVVQGLSKYFQDSERGKYMPEYVAALRKLLYVLLTTLQTLVTNSTFMQFA